MAKYRLATAWCRFNGVSAGVFLFFMPMIGFAQTDPASAVVTTPAKTAAVTETLETLVSFVKSYTLPSGLGCKRVCSQKKDLPEEVCWSSESFGSPRGP